MLLSRERVNEIGLMVLQQKLEEDGSIILRPKQIRRDVHNWAKNLGLKPTEVAELLIVVLEAAYNKTMSELGKIVEN